MKISSFQLICAASFFIRACAVVDSSNTNENDRRHRHKHGGDKTRKHNRVKEIIDNIKLNNTQQTSKKTGWNSVEMVNVLQYWEWKYTDLYLHMKGQCGTKKN